MMSTYDVVDIERTELIARIDEANDRLASLIRTLETTQKGNRTLRERLVCGDSLRDAFFEATSVPEELGKFTRDLKELEHARHRARTAVFALGLAEGLSIGEMGRLYGFSRQLAQRFAKEARDGLTAAGAPGTPTTSLRTAAWTS
jgi:hypothetical protein